MIGAGEANRTLVTCLGSKCSTIELHPRRYLITARQTSVQDAVSHFGWLMHNFGQPFLRLLITFDCQRTLPNSR